MFAHFSSKMVSLLLALVLLSLVACQSDGPAGAREDGRAERWDPDGLGMPLP